MTRGKETRSLMIENFSPRKEASNMVMGIRHSAEAPRYVNMTLNLAPLL